jgi:alkylhydroperoxidase family enzyme
MPVVSEKQGLLVRAANWYTKRAYGRETAIAGVMAHTPANLLGYGALEFAYERSHRAPERIKALAATKAATTVGCAFCIDIASAISRDAGVSEDQLRDFHVYRDSPAFSEDEKLAMEYAEAMTQQSVVIPEELTARLRARFDEAQLVDLTAAIAIENFRARFNTAMDIPPAGFSGGAFCPMPERAATAAAAG